MTSPPTPTASSATADTSGRSAVRRRSNRWPLGRITTVGLLLLGVFLVAAIIVGASALSNLSTARNRVVNVLDPAAIRASQLYAALLNQETGLRGYLLSGNQDFLKPYNMGLASQQAQVNLLRPLLVSMPPAKADLSQILSYVGSWRSNYAAPAISQVASTGKPYTHSDVYAGKQEFDLLRTPMASLQAYLSAQRSSAVGSLNTSATILTVTLVVIALALLAVVTAIAVGLRAAAIDPLSRLAGSVRRVADGDFDHEVGTSGPREIHELAIDVNRMRRRILRELSAVRAANVTLEARAVDLERSNSELEQFAYVASHDLQEPLRKVASFCQLLQRRYIGQLDARADQYIEFAVDGAKRMQALIDDLLAFSRVGRIEREPALVSCANALSQARVNLTAEIRRSGAAIETTELPTVRAEFSLLTSLFQNLVGNAIKFRGEDAPRIEVASARDGDYWLVSVADNGLGIDPEYADRIFVIFQRLHDRSAYAGTGIGLAMCRKIVEHYGGKIWLDTSYQAGAKFCFTLPVPPVEDEENPDD